MAVRKYDEGKANSQRVHDVLHRPDGRYLHSQLLSSACMACGCVLRGLGILFRPANFQTWRQEVRSGSTPTRVSSRT